MTEDEIKALEEVVEQRWRVGGCIGSLPYAKQKEREEQILAERRRYANGLRNAADIPNEKGRIT